MAADGSGSRDVGVSRWKSAAAEERFRALYSEATDSMLRDLERAGLPPATVIDVDSRFGRTRCLHWKGAGDPIVLLHGHNGSWLSWAPLLAELPGRDVFALDTVGEPGGSLQRAPIGSASDLAAWLRSSLDDLGLQRCVVVGMSYGGWIAAHFAAAHPEAVVALVLLEPAIGTITMKRVLRHGMAVAGTQLLPPPLKRLVARRIDAEPLVYDWRLRKPSTVAFRKFDRRIPTYAKLDDPTPDEVLTSIDAATLVVLGGRSELHDVDDVSAKARRLIANVQLHIVDGASHALPVTKASAVAALMHPFLDEHAGTSTTPPSPLAEADG